MARFAVSPLVLLTLSLCMGVAKAGACSEVDHECTRTGCCSTPFSSCYKKNENVSFCRLGCEPGYHADDPKEYRTWWSCELVTWGCNIEYKACEGAKGQGDVVPCCQEGCICNYTSTYFHQCIPLKGTQCSEDGPQKKPDFSKLDGAKKDDGDDDDDDDDDDEAAGEEAGDDDDGALPPDCLKVGEQMMGPGCPKEKTSGGSKDGSDDEAGEPAPAAAPAGKLPPGCLKVGSVMMGSGCPKKKDSEDVVSDAESVHVALPQGPRVPPVMAATAACAVLAVFGMMLWRGSRGADRGLSMELGERLSEEEESS